MSTRSRLLCATLLFAALPAWASATEDELPAAERYHLRLEYLWWSPQLDGQLQKGTSEGEGTILDAQADLALRETAANLLQATLRVGGRWKLRAAWHRMGYDGDAEATKVLDYASVHVGPNDRIQTSIKAHEVTGALECDLMQRSIGYAGLLLGAKYFNVNTTVTGLADGTTVVGRVTSKDGLPVPIAGLAVRLYPHERVSVEGEFLGFPAGSHGHLWEATVAARGHLGDRLAVTAGWRKVSLDGRTDRGSLKLGLSKWTLGVEISL